MLNVDPKGVSRPVERYRVESFGLYMARPAPHRPQFDYLESWLLPDLGLRITDFWFRPGYERDQDFYLDVVTIDRIGDRWRTVDHYLDLVVCTGRNVEVLDTDELLAATNAGLLDAESAGQALHTAYRTVDGLASHGHDLDRWLFSMGIELTWRRKSDAPQG